MTRKGRFRKRDGRYQSHIFRYDGRCSHPAVQEGLKLELIQRPTRLPLTMGAGLYERTVPLVGPVETAMGKWQGLATRLAGRRRSGSDYCRHPLDLALMSNVLPVAFSHPPQPLADRVAERRGPAVTPVLRELQDPLWEASYEDYISRMGMLPIADGVAFAYPTWKTVHRRLAGLALDMDLVPHGERAEVREMGPGTAWDNPGA